VKQDEENMILMLAFLTEEEKKAVGS